MQRSRYYFIFMYPRYFVPVRILKLIKHKCAIAEPLNLIGDPKIVELSTERDCAASLYSDSRSNRKVVSDGSPDTVDRRCHKFTKMLAPLKYGPNSRSRRRKTQSGQSYLHGQVPLTLQAQTHPVSHVNPHTRRTHVLFGCLQVYKFTSLCSFFDRVFSACLHFTNPPTLS